MPVAPRGAPAGGAALRAAARGMAPLAGGVPRPFFILRPATTPQASAMERSSPSPSGVVVGVQEGQPLAGTAIQNAVEPTGNVHRQKAGDSWSDNTLDRCVLWGSGQSQR